MLTTGCNQGPSPSPASAAFDQFFGALTSNNTTEAITYISANCTPSPEIIANVFFMDGLVYNPNYCTYQVLASSFTDNLATIQTNFTLGGMVIDTDNHANYDATFTVKELTFVLSNEGGNWRIINFPIPSHEGIVISYGVGYLEYFECLANHNSLTDENSFSEINFLISPEVNSGTPSQFSQPWTAVTSTDGPGPGWVNIAYIYDSGDYAITFTVYTTAEPPFDQYTVRHHYRIAP